ncbi:adenylate/guanylate cyclase domain-containing protein [Mycobacterium sp.]|uniref:adenylate/guanylate cyclase domain-containing protein n=1 Tax=Mycobacterium sp. TaxID=1785 RepID=UPI003D6BEFA8
MAAKKCDAASQRAEGAFRKPDCVEALRAQPRVRDEHYAQRLGQRFRVLTATAVISAVVSVAFGIVGLAIARDPLAALNLGMAPIFAMIPWLHRFGELVAPLTFIFCAYLNLVVMGWHMGTGTGIQFFFLVGACVIVVLLGTDHIVLASVLAAIGAALTIALQVRVPEDTGVQPQWAYTMYFAISVVSAWAMVVVILWYAGRVIARAEQAMELEYQTSEALLANILPASIATRLKDPARDLIADKYDDASVLFADIAGFTEQASDTPPDELIRFLNRLFTDFDGLVDKYGLEKIKVSGDSYMVVSGVPWPRRDHVEALAHLALDMADTAAALTGQPGKTVPLRIGLASGPVVAGVVGSRRFFYDVWGDAVNVASRMESTDAVGRIQVPEVVYERLRGGFVLEERGEVNVKGKGMMRTWYLVGRKPGAGEDGLRAEAPQTADV